MEKWQGATESCISNLSLVTKYLTRCYLREEGLILPWGLKRDTVDLCGARSVRQMTSSQEAKSWQEVEQAHPQRTHVLLQGLT